jgi:hypothetical protein
VNLFVDDTTVGGVYFIHITHLGGNPVRFRYDGKEDDDFVLVKFGRTDDFSTRWPQYRGVKFKILWSINGDNGMEAALKKFLPPNFKKSFYTAKVATLHGYFGIEGSPGTSEWRIMGKALVNKLANCAINNLNYKQKILNLAKERWNFEAGEVKFSVGDHKQKNRLDFSVHH